jgi:hypothetical protein
MANETEARTPVEGTGRIWKIGMVACFVLAILTAPLMGSSWAVVEFLGKALFPLSIFGLLGCGIAAWITSG